MGVHRLTARRGYMNNQTLSFHDHKPRTLSLHDAVVNGLSRQQKAIEPKFFYDQRGSELFELICEQPEYYPPTVEQQLLVERANEIARITGSGRGLVCVSRRQAT